MVARSGAVTTRCGATSSRVRSNRRLRPGRPGRSPELRARGPGRRGGDPAGRQVLGATTGAGRPHIVETTAGTHSADVVVNAAGAWADGVAEAFGAAPAGLRPLRRTLAVARPSRRRSGLAVRGRRR